MKESDTVPLVVVGSVALDTVQTPREKRERILGGSCSYACAAASYFTPCGMVGIVGDDFADEHTRMYERLGIDTRGLQRVRGKTFEWSGVYERNMNNRNTLATELNVFADFRPELPDSYRSAPFLFLANIAPELQLHVLSQVSASKFTAADTMNLWISGARKELLEVISRVDLLMVNESEAQMLASEENLVTAARRILALGPSYVIIKKGENGAFLSGANGMFMVPSFPLEEVADPTGAGDAFAGAFMGALAAEQTVDSASVRRSMMYGTVVASFCCEAFSVDKLVSLERAAIERRLALLKDMIAVRGT